MPEAAVWDHVAELLADPARLVAQFARLAAVEDGSDRERAADQLLRTRMERNSRADKRLLDADEAGVISLAEMSERRHRPAEERRALDRQQQERERLRQQRAQAEAARSSLEAFCSRIGSRLENTSFTDKQAILQLVIERIIVGDGSLEIRQVIPLSPGAPSGSGNPAPQPQSRSDGVDKAGLPGGPQHPRHGGPQALMGVGDDEPDAAQASAHQAAEEVEPEGLGLRGADGHAQHFAPPVAVDADGDGHGDRDDAPASRTFT